MPTPTRDEALALLHEYTKTEALRSHALAVEAAMCFYARHYGEDPERWGIVGLLHDFDYERYPTAEDHPAKGSEILREHDYPDDIIQAILGHAPHTGVARETLMAKALFAVDELCGLVTAVSLVRPSKQVGDVKVKSVKKKMKMSAFARNVNREDIKNGAAELDVDIDEHIGRVIEAMKGVAGEIGL